MTAQDPRPMVFHLLNSVAPETFARACKGQRAWEEMMGNTDRTVLVTGATGRHALYAIRANHG